MPVRANTRGADPGQEDHSGAFKVTLHHKHFAALDLDVAMPSENLGQQGQRFYRTYGKRALDMTLVLISLPLVLPLVALLAVLIAFEGGKPFYTQPRLGRNGKVYRIWKLRSMVPNADALLESHLAANPDARREWDTTQKLKNDPRITRLGRFLRRSSLDELPQLWNVLKGDMSLVGPRPMMPCQHSLYPGVDYNAMRPGITGSWQVSARNDSSFADRARFDSGYFRALSFGTDLKLLAATFRVVLRATGH